MEAYPSALIVLDTAVLVSALVGPEGTPHHRVIELVASGGVLLALSDASLGELSRVVGRPGLEPQIRSAARALRCGPDLGVMGYTYRPTRYDWPSVTDRKDLRELLLREVDHLHRVALDPPLGAAGK